MLKLLKMMRVGQKTSGIKEKLRDYRCDYLRVIKKIWSAVFARFDLDGIV